MRPASIILAVAERDSHAFRWLRLAADRRKAGDYYDARIALRTSRLWPNPRIPS